jgi:crotonobetainyl-CoA:carnitine CoA-transferase CaiB-like acyl-CoA transferase
VFSGIDSAEAEHRLTAARVAWSRVRDPLAVWEHEQLAARDRKMEIDHPGGKATMLRPPFGIADMPDPPSHVPPLGDHDPALVDRLRRGRDGTVD